MAILDPESNDDNNNNNNNKNNNLNFIKNFTINNLQE